MAELVFLTPMPESRKQTIEQFVRFFIVGISNTAVDFGVYIALTRLISFFGEHIYIASTISFLVAATWSYFANRSWTFKQGDRANVSEATKFYFSTGISFLFNLGTFSLVVHALGLYSVVLVVSGHKVNDIMGKLAGTGVSMISNFVLNKLWVFKNA